MATPSRQRLLGQYFTPPAVIRAAFSLLDEISGRPVGQFARIIDPACGDGAFLRYAIEQGIAGPRTAVGIDYDASFEMPGAARPEDGPGFIRYSQNGLMPILGEEQGFDYVVGNPPYGIGLVGLTAAGKASALADLATGFTIWTMADSGAHKSGKLSQKALKSFASAPIEILFLERFVQLAKSGNSAGMIAIVIPDGILANARQFSVRRWLAERATIEAIISLPRETFRGVGTTAKTSLMVLKAEPAPPEHRVFLASAGDLNKDLMELAAQWKFKSDQRKSSRLDISFVEQSDAEFLLRMDAEYWGKAHRHLIADLREISRTARLADVVDPRTAIITGDHVRRSRGETKGYELDSPYEYYETAGFCGTGYNTARIKRCSANAYQRLSYTAVQCNDILVSCAGAGGVGRARACLISHQPGPSCTGDVFILRLPVPLAYSVYLFLLSKFGRRQIERLRNGTGTVNINARELLSLEIPLLSSEFQAQLAEGVRQLMRLHAEALACLTKYQPPLNKLGRGPKEAQSSEPFRKAEAHQRALVEWFEGQLSN